MTDYAFYRDSYCGTSIPEAEWGLFGARAAEQLAAYKRLYTVTAPDTDAEDLAVCAMADALCYFTAAQNGTGGTLSAASIGSVSVTYGASGAVDISARAQAKELYRCACRYLEIYRGVGG